MNTGMRLGDIKHWEKKKGELDKKRAGHNEVKTKRKSYRIK